MTPYAFKKFQKKFERATQYLVHEENCIEFVLQYYKDETSLKQTVLWDGEITNCSCKYFEFWCILCHHILSVFLHKDCYHIPLVYLLSHWCCEVSLSEKELLVLTDENLVGKKNVVDANVNGVIAGDCFINFPFLLKINNRPKQSQMKGRRELGKPKKTCGLSKHVAHNIFTGLEKETCTSLNGVNKMKRRDEENFKCSMKDKEIILQGTIILFY